LIDIAPNQSQIRIMHQGCGLQRLAGLLLSQLRSRESPELIVDQWQQLLGSLRIARCDLREEERDAAGHEQSSSCKTARVCCSLR
jgi:hypothetical protein